MHVRLDFGCCQDLLGLQMLQELPKMFDVAAARRGGDREVDHIDFIEVVEWLHHHRSMMSGCA